MSFTVNTGRKYDTQNVFQDVNKLLRSSSDRLCRGNTPGANQRREDLIKILTEAVHILKAQAPKEVHKEEAPKEEQKTDDGNVEAAK